MVEKLKKLTSECEFIEASAIVDEQGLIISKYEKPEAKYDIEEIASSIVNPVLRMSEIISDISGESENLDELVIFTTDHVIIINKLAYETYLVALVKKTPIYNKARFKLRVKIPEIKLSL